MSNSFSWWRKNKARKAPRSRTRLSLEPLEDRTLFAVNPITLENQLPGNPQSEWDVVNGGDNNIEGYASNISVDQGQTVNFKINTDSTNYRLDIYRMGYYAGLGARKVATIQRQLAQPQDQPDPIIDFSTGLVDAGNWQVSVSWTVPANATSGIYFAKLVRQDSTAGANHIVFVVRDDDGHSDLLFQTSDTTWQAYNAWGGSSLYVGSPVGRSYKVSYNRPFSTRTVSGGLGESNFVFWSEYPMVRWLESNGYNVSYFTNLDTAIRGTELLEHKIFLSVGHDEYWSAEMRNNVEAARDAGINLAFFSGNELYWKIRWENSIDGSNTPYTTLVCYKESTLGADQLQGLPPEVQVGYNFGGVEDPSPIWTGLWRDLRFDNDAKVEQLLTGQIFSVNRGPGGMFGTAIQVPEADGKMRLWRGTSVANLQPGEVATLTNGTLGYEWDEDVDSGYRPLGLIRMSSTTEFVPEKLVDPISWPGCGGIPGAPCSLCRGCMVAPGQATHNLTMYKAPSGALVFGAGTVQWSWGLDGKHDGGVSVPDVRMQQATVNLFADMGVEAGLLQPGLVQTSASTDTIQPDTVITSPGNGLILQSGSQPILITGTAADFGGGVVGGVEVSADGGLTWHPANGRGSWSYSWVPSVAGTMNFLARAVDDSLNLDSSPASITVTVVPDETTPPAISNVAAAVLNSQTVTLTWDTDEASTSRIFFGTAPGNLNQVVSDSAMVSAHSITLSSLTPNTIYYYRVQSVDEFNNASTIPVSGANVFSTPAFTDSTTADFAAGTIPSGLYAAQAGDGELILAPTAGAEFSDSVLPAGWTSTAWSAGGAATVAGGSVSVDGARVGPTALYGPGRSLEFVATFSGAAFQHVGFGIDMSGPPWLVFSTGSGGVLYARSSGSSTIETQIPGNWLGSTHRYRIDWGSNTAIYWIDGVQVASHAVTVAGVLRPLISDATPGGGAVVVDWMRLSPYEGAGSFISRIFNAGSQVAWNNFNWIQSAPTGTGLTFSIRMGNTPTPDTSWTDWVIVATSGNVVGGVSRYLQYRVVLSSSAPGATPTLQNVTISYNSNQADATPPSVSTRTPAPGSVNVSPGLPVAISFTELMNASTFSAGKVSLRQVGAGSDTPANLSFLGATATLTPTQALLPETVYQATLAGTVKDAAGNPLGADVTWTFTTGWLTVGDTAATDFGGGTAVGVVVTQTSDGEVSLAPASVTEFTGLSLPADWTSIPWNSGGNSTVSGGILTVDGAMAGTTATFGPGRTLEFVGSFSGDPFQHAGLGTDFSSGSPWMLFSTSVGGALYARTTGPLGSTETQIPGNWLGAQHTFRIVWGTASVVYSIDGIQVASHPVAIGNNLRPVFSDFSTGGGFLTVDRVLLGPYAASGSIISRAFDAGNQVSWNQAFWSTATPVGTTIAASVRMGDTPTPDGTWTVWIPLATSGVNIGGVSRYIQYRAELGTVDPATTPILSDFSVRYTNALPDTTVPIVISHSPASGAAEVSNDTSITVSFGELMDVNSITTASFRLRQVGTSSDIPATISLFGSTATLTPNATLSANRQYQVTLAGGIKDRSGNTLGTDLVWTFSTASLSLQDKTVGNFSAGSFVSTSVTQSGDGEVRLAPTASSDFQSAALPAGWTSTTWNPGGASTVTDGLLTVDGAFARTDALYSPGRSLEFLANFSGDPYQHAGLVQDFSSALWAMFSTSAGGGLYARTASASGSADTLLPGNWLGTTHLFRIDWTATGVVYSIDGTEVASHAIAIASSLRPAFSDLNTGGGSLQVDWMRLGPYAATGSFTSRIFDAGTAVTWDQVMWTASSPEGTSLALSVRLGNSATPDASWTSWTLLPSSGTAVGGSSRYLQYRADLATGDPARTPSLDDVTIRYTLDADTLAPSVVSRSPSAGATNVDHSAPIIIGFSELLDAATITSANFRLRAVGAGSDVAAAVTFVGSTVTLQPTVSLDTNTQYQVTVANGVADASGNTLGVDLTWTFTTGIGAWQQTSAADFDAGTQTGTTTTSQSGGEVQLTALFLDNFTADALDAAWTSTSTSSAGGGPESIALNGGILTLAGTIILTTQPLVNVPFEGRVNFAAAPFQHFGLATSLSAVAGEYYAMFSTGGTSDRLFARVNASGATQDIDIGPLPGGFHIYQVKPIGSAFEFYVDGVLRTTISSSFPIGTPLRGMMSVHNGSTSMQVDWVRSLTFASSGSFTSSVFDATESVTWAGIEWSGAAPPGTTLALSVRMGDTPTPDASWTEFIPVSNSGAQIGGRSRYIQYRANFATVDPVSTPTLTAVTVSYSTSADSIAPSIVSSTPAAGATGAETDSAVTVQFSELIDASSVTEATVRLREVGGSTDLPAAVTFAGSTATLTPLAGLGFNKSYVVFVSGTITDVSGNPLGADISWTFTTASSIDTTSPSVMSTGPAAGTIGVPVGANVTATFSEQIQATTVSFILKDAAGNVVPGHMSYDATTRKVTLDPSVNLVPLGSYSVFLSGARDLAGNLMTPLSWTFTTSGADTIAPTITAQTPGSSATGVPTNSSVSATFSESVQASTIAFTLIAGSTPIAGSLSYNAALKTVTFTPSASLSNSTTFTATLSGARDLSGNIMAPVSWTFTTTAVADTTAPTVTSRSPGVGAAGVAFGANVTATFSEAIQASTITFNLTTGSTTIPGVVSYDPSSRTIRVDPTATLAASTTYLASLSGARDLSGNVLAPISWIFTTASADATAPTVTSRTPAVGATGVAAGSNVTATFSEAVQANTISFTLTIGLTSIPAGLAYNATTRVASLDPNGPLSPSTTYTATLSGVQDLAGNTMAPVSWTFTTAAAADATAPTVTSRSPASGATGVAAGSNVTATFSEAVQLSTLSFTLTTGSTIIPAGLTYNATTRVASLDPNGPLSPSTTYTATLTGAQDLSGNAMAPVSWTFTTAAAADATAPTVTSRSPAVGATGVAAGANVTATFSEAVQENTISFTLTTGSTTIPVAVTYNATTRVATLDPTGNLAPSTTYTATVSGALDLSGNVMAPVSWTFTTAAAADATAPTVTSRSPAVGATGVAAAVNVTATFSEAVQENTISFTLTTGSTTIPVAVTYNATTRVATLDPTGNLAPSTTYTATVSGAQDLAGNVMAPVSWTFTTAAAADATAPTVTSRSPAVGATGVAAAANVTATFSEAVQENTISFTLTTGSTTIPVAVTYNATTRVATLDPTGNLAPSTTYTATVSGAQDLAGNVMAPVSWTFTTAAAADATAPTVTSRAPAVGATGVPAGSNVTATFSEAVQENTISFTLTTGSTTIPVAVTYNATTRVATLDPTGNLAPSTTYTATLNSAQDLSGNAMAPVSWTFTTAAAADATAPTVTSRSPGVGATGVPRDTAVMAVFSEAVQENTITFTLRNGSTTVATTLNYDAPTRMVSITPNSDLSNSTTYTATLSGAQDLSGNVLSTLTWTFTTASAPSSPFVSSRTPEPNAIGFPVANSITATFNGAMQSSSINSTNFTLRDSSNNLVSASVTYSSSSLTATLNPSSTLALGATYTATLSGVRNASNTLMTTVSWTFATAGTADTTAPTISTRTPASGATGVAAGANVAATFNEDVQASTIGFTLRIGSGSPLAAALVYDAASRTATLDPNVDLSPSTTYTATVSGAQDLRGNTMTSSSWTFTTAAATDATAPTISSRSPASSATGVAAAANVTATMSEDVQASTISFTLRIGSGSPLAAVATYDAVSRTITLDPNVDLAPSTTYTATLSGAQDLWGNTMTSSSWTFTTAAATDATAPSISSRSPASGATGVAAAANVSATMSDDVQASTVSFTLRIGSGSPLATVVTYDAASRTVTLDPNVDLTPSTTYTATLSGAQDLWGNTMTSSSWTFTTAAATDATAPTISSRSPASGATGVAAGANVTATMSEDVQASTISFTLRIGSGSPLAAVATYDAASRTVTLDPNVDLVPSTTYTATLSGAQDLWGNTMTSSSWSFTTAAAVDSTAPTISTRSPASGATGVAAGSNVTATLSEDIQASTVSFILRIGAGSPLAAVVSYDAASRTFTLDPNLDLAPSTTYTATLSGAQDLWGNTMTSSSWSFTTAAAVDSTVPTISTRSPASGATGVAAGSNVTATLSEDIQASTVSFILRIGAGSPLAAVVSYDAASRTFTLDPNVEMAPSTTYTATLSGAQDLWGNTMTSSSWSFTTAAAVDVTAPTISTRSPASGATAVAAGTNVTATLSEDIQASTISFTLQIGAGSPLAVVVSYDAATRTVTLDPNVDLAPSTTYTATLSGAQDLWGNTMTSSSWSFTTAAAVDATAPTISTRSPASGATGVTAGTNVTATLNEDIQASTISFVLRIGAGSPVAAVLSYDAASRTITLDPNVDLAPSTTYTATLSGAQDLWGNTMTSSSWSFTTAAAVVPDTTAPTVTTRSPAIGSTGVPVGTNLMATLSEDVQSNSILFTLVDGANNPVPAAVTYDVATRTVTLDPNVNLTFSTTYTATLSGVQDLAGNAIAPISWSFSTAAAIDSIAPSLTTVNPGSGATGVVIESAVAATFSERVQSMTINLELRDGSNNLVPAAVSYDWATRTVTLTPATPLAFSTSYTVTLTGVQDLSGNTMAPTSWSFVTVEGPWTQTTASDFNAGTTSGTTVSNSAGGELQLATTLDDDFGGTSLGSAWVHDSWQPSGGGAEAITFENGILSLAGTQIRSAQTSSDVTVEGRISFSAAPYQYFGIATDLSAFAGNYWAIIGRIAPGSNLFARVNSSGTTQDVDLGSLPGGFHVYRIAPIATGFEFYVDDVIQTTINITFPSGTPLRVTFSVFNDSSSGSMQVDWVRLLGYAPVGTFNSTVFDAARIAIWGPVNWNALLPTGTSIVVETRSGDTETPDVGWSDWVEVSNGGTVTSPSSRYLQYRIKLFTTNPSVTPTLFDITFVWS